MVGKPTTCTGLRDDGHGDEEVGGKESMNSEAIANIQSDSVGEHNRNSGFVSRDEAIEGRVLEIDHHVPEAEDEKGEQLPQHVPSSSPLQSADHWKDKAQEIIAPNQILTPATGIEDEKVPTDPVEDLESLKLESEVQTSAQQFSLSQIINDNSTPRNSLLEDPPLGTTIYSDGSDVEGKKDLSHAILESVNSGDVQINHVKDEELSSEKEVLTYSTSDIENLGQEHQIAFTESTNTLLEEESCNILTDALYSAGITSDSLEYSLLSERTPLERDPDHQDEVSDTTVMQLKVNFSDGNLTGRTRSGARFSDDTNMLKDFLSRAQARRAAITTTQPKEPVSPAAQSLRKILGQRDNNSTTPTTPKDALKKPTTPLSEPVMDLIEERDAERAPKEPASIRRSTRKRHQHLAGSTKIPTSAPSFIPVRRTDGTDPVVLRKSVTHELTMVTRANTRRNKGQSKMPKLVLQDLIVQGPEERESTRAMGAKMVSWDERLVQYQEAREAQEAQEGEEAKRPKIRQLRGLGASNGTPAPKRLPKDASMPKGR